MESIKIFFNLIQIISQSCDITINSIKQLKCNKMDEYIKSF